VRIARFAAGGEPQYGVVELAEDGGPNPETVSVLTGDPMAMSVKLTGERKELEGVRLLAPVIPRSKIVGVGRNYAAHAAEMSEEVPKTPLTFYKPNTSVIGPGEPIIYPAASREVSYEGELAVVIGRICKEVPISRVPEVIFGYTARAVDQHPSGDRGSCGRRDSHHPRRRAASRRQYQGPDLHNPRACRLHILLYNPAARGCDLDRYAGRRRADASRASGKYRNRRNWYSQQSCRRRGI
jgi:hypothetical protein